MSTQIDLYLLSCTYKHDFMPIVHRFKDLKLGYELAVWEAAEALDEILPLEALNGHEKERYLTFTHSNRKREFLTVRRLVRELAGNHAYINYGENGKPALQDGRKLSISHSGGLIAVIISNEQDAGIDIEKLRDNIGAIAPKFISSDEILAFGNTMTEEAMHLIWGAKEVMFKIYGKGEVDFKTHLKVEPAVNGERGKIQGMINKSDFKAGIEISFLKLEDSMLVWAVGSRSTFD